MEERLLSIIAAQFAGEILPEADRVLLEEWLERLPENRREYGRLEQWYQSNAGFRVRKGINCEVAWESILEKKRVADGLRRRLFWHCWWEQVFGCGNREVKSSFIR